MDDGRILETTNRNRKKCSFNAISAEEMLISKYMTAITDKKLRDKITKKNIGIEENNRTDKTKLIREKE